jgi:sterol desaturase/sphingolipid hydroxylase (fatty acid hydroxylase superfamily)
MDHWLLLWFGVFFGIGLLTHLAEKRWPLRTYQKPKAWAVDTLGFAIATAVAVTFQRAYPHTFGRLPTVPGFQWISAASQFVEAAIPWPVAFLVSVVVLDFLLYLGHRLLHMSYLWHTHAAHHSVEQLYWFGGNRASPFHVVLQLVWGSLLGLVWPINGRRTGFAGIFRLAKACGASLMKNSRLVIASPPTFAHRFLP